MTLRDACTMTLVGALTIFGCAGAPSSKGKANPEADPIQARRWDHLQNLIDDRVLHKLEWSGTVARGYVGPAFFGLAYDDKRMVADLIFVYCHEKSSSIDLVVLHDWRNNERVGSYSRDFAGMGPQFDLD